MSASTVTGIPETTGEITHTIDGETFHTAYSLFGDLASGVRPLVALHGGPGIPHNYIRAIARLSETHGVPVLMYDQLGCGKSTHLRDKPADFWTVELFMAELDNVLAHFGITNDFAVLGHSWGGMLAANYAITRLGTGVGLKKLVISNSPASMELWVKATGSLLAAFPDEFRATLKKHEDAGTTESDEYQACLNEFYLKHACRKEPWPEELKESFAGLGEDPTVYGTMNGPSEFTVVGSLKTWTVVDELHKITVPTLLINGRYDEAQDVCVQPFFDNIPQVKWITFAESSHMPHVEEAERYLEVVGGFLAQ